MIKRLNKSKKSKKGAILVIVVLILALAMIFIASAMMLTQATRRRLYSTAMQSQARLTVTAASEVFLEALKMQEITDTQLESIMGKTHGPGKTKVKMVVDNVPGMSNNDNNCTYLDVYPDPTDATFVYCEFTLLIPVIDKLAKSKFKYLVFAISPLEMIVMRLLPQVAGYEINTYISLIMSVSCLGWFSYFYLGYLLGNGLLKINFANKKLYILLVISMMLQIAEGYWYYLMGNQNCGTQLKLSSVLTGCIFMIIAYNIIESEKYREVKPLYSLGECSFGIYFSHIAIMSVLNHIPHYSELIIFPLNAIIAVLISFIFVLVGKRLLGKNSKYLAL